MSFFKIRILRILFLLLGFSLSGQSFDYSLARKLSVQPDKNKLAAYLQETKENLNGVNKVYHQYFSALYYRYTADKEKQIQHLIRGYDLLNQEYEQDSIKAMFLDEFALVYKNENDNYQEALIKINESIRIKHKLDKKDALARSYLIKASIFYTMDHLPGYLDSVKTYYNLVNKYNVSGSYKNLVLNNLATIAIDEGDTDEVEKNLLAANQFNLESGFIENASLNLNNLVSYFNTVGEYDKSKVILDTLLDYVDKNNFNLALREILINKGNLYENLGDYKQASYWKDSLYSYEVAVKNVLLDEELMKVENLTLENELAKEKAAQLRSRLLMSIFGALAALFAILGFAVYRIQRLRRESLNQELETTKIQATLDATRAKMEGEQKERQSIASTLHDQVASLLTAADMHLKVARKRNTEEPALENAAEILKNINYQVRDLSHQLVSPTLMKFGLEPAIDTLVSQLNNEKLKFNLIAELKTKRLAQEIENFVYNSCSELLQNVIKHSGASQCQVSLNTDKNQLTLRVTDNGTDKRQDQNSHHLGLGLTNIKARAEALKGSFQLNSLSSSTEAILEIPI